MRFTVPNRLKSVRIMSSWAGVSTWSTGNASDLDIDGDPDRDVV